MQKWDTYSMPVMTESIMNDYTNLAKADHQDDVDFLSVLKKNPAYIELFIKSLSVEQECVYQRSLCKVVKLASQMDPKNFSSETINKITLLSQTLLPTQAVLQANEKLEKCFEYFHQAKVPSLFKLRSDVLEAVTETYIENFRFIAPQEFCDSIRAKQKLLCKEYHTHVPFTTDAFLGSLINKALKIPPEHIDPVEQEKHVCCPLDFKSNIIPIEFLSVLRHKLPPKDTKQFHDLLLKQLRERCLALKSNFESMPDENLSELRIFSRNLIHLTSIIQELGLWTTSNPLLQAQLLSLENSLGDKFIAVFKSYHTSIGAGAHGPISVFKNHPSSKGVGVHDPLDTKRYLYMLMNPLLRLGLVIHGAEEFYKFAAEIEDRIFKIFTSSFNTKILTCLSKSSEYDPKAKPILSSILEISNFLDTETKDLKSFVACFDKIYFNLFCIRDTLMDPMYNDIIFNTLTGILKALVQKAISEFEKSEPSQNIDLSIGDNIQLKKRLEIVMGVISDLLKSQIEVRIKMKVKEDPLIAILYQIHSAIYSVNPDTLQMIKQWIKTHQHYDLPKFQTWLLSKLRKRSPIVVQEKDIDLIYAQFISETDDPS